MNIAIDIRMMFNACKGSGIETYCRNIAYYILKQKSSAFKFYFMKYQHDKLPFSDVNVINMPFKKPRFLEKLLLPGILKKYKIDIFHSLYNGGPILKSDKFKVISTVHDLFPLTYPQFVYYKMDIVRKLKNKIFYYFVLKSFKNSTKLISISKFTAQDLVKYGIASPNRISVIYHGIDRNLFKPASKNEPLPISGVPDKYVLFLGALEKRKNPDTVIKAIARMKKPVHVVFCGGDKYDIKRLKDKAQQDSVLNYVTFTGYLDFNKMVKVLQKAHIFVFPSLLEGFGFPPLEAMACGVPVISSKTSALLEVVNNACITLQNPLDAGELAEKIESLFYNENLRKDIIKKGYSHVKDFTWEKSVQNLLGIYKLLEAQKSE